MGTISYPGAKSDGVDPFQYLLLMRQPLFSLSRQDSWLIYPVIQQVNI